MRSRSLLARRAASLSFPPTTLPSNTVPIDSATIGLQLWFAHSPWQPSAGWALLTALLASGQVTDRLNDPLADPVTSQTFLPWQQIALLWLLVDLLWGALWRFANGRSALLPLPGESQSIDGSTAQLDSLPLAYLPYMQPGSPAARLLGWDRADVWPWMMRVASPALLVSLLVAATLGKMALLLTVVVALCAILGWTLRRSFARPPALLQSIVTIGLPWLLTLWQLGIQLGHSHWRMSIILMSLWVLHNWGSVRISCYKSRWEGARDDNLGDDIEDQRSDDDRIGIILLFIADLCIITLLIYIQVLLWVALLLAVFFPCWVAIIRKQQLGRQKAGQQEVSLLRFCWLLGMLISGIAVS